MQLLLFDQRTDRSTLERGDPANLLAIAHLGDGLLRDHSPVTDHHHALDAEVRAQTPHLGQEGGAVRGVALMHRHRHRTAPGVGEQAIIDLQHAVLAVTVVAALGQRAAGALEVTG